MRILITNNALDRRGGAELHTRDLARAFQSRGHQVMVFSSARERGPRFLDLDSVPVATDLEHLEFKPDLIHGQHHLDLMAAVTALPDVPAIFHVHEAVWQEVPPLHPRIYRYFTVTPSMKERLMSEFSLSAELIDVVPNGADLTRFRTVREPQEKPKRAVIFHRAHREDEKTTDAIRKACDRHGISLDIIGYGIGRTIEHPEEVLANYDLVFASGMAAIDAAACGGAVIILGRAGSGPLLGEENFDALRAANFSLPAGSPPSTPALVEQEIGKYSREKALAVTSLMREKADLSPGVDRILEHYEEVIQLHLDSEPDWQAEVRSVSRYLQRIVPLIKIMDNSLVWDTGMPMTMADALGDLQVQMARFQEQMTMHLQKKTTGVE